MAKQIIIDWQRDNLLVAVGQSHGSALTIERVSEQRIGDTENGATADDAVGTAPRNGDAAQGLSRAIDELGLRKSDVTIVASRDLVEVRTLSIPRMDLSDLPDVIRFQAQRQLANMGDNWALDYVILPEEPGQETLTALVGVISPPVLNEMEAACNQAGVQLTHVALRPIEIARYATAIGKIPSGDVSMVICLSDQDADLMILNRGSLVLVRGTKLPSDPQQVPQALNGELRRSLMAAASQLGGKSINGALLIATPSLSGGVHELIAEVLGCQVSVVDPSDLLAANLPRREELAQQSTNRIVGLAGALNFAAAEQKTKLDFKNPKKRPPPKSKTTTYLLAGAATALLAVGGVYWWTSTNQALDSDLAMYQDQVKSQQELKKSAEEKIAELSEVEKFLEASPNWLDELSYLAEKIPPADKVLVGEPAFSVQADGTGRITMPVAADSASTITTFEQSLRDEAHVVAGKNSQQFPPKEGELYKWRVDETISIRGRGWKLAETLGTSRATTTEAVQQ